MKVVSYFDGMSCGQIALNKEGIHIDEYLAYEIDKYAIKVTQANYPNTKQRGSVTEAKAEDLQNVDLFLGGSPCQGFSFAGKQLNFNDPRSALFFEFVKAWDIIKASNPGAKFLLENVKMKKEYQDVISGMLGVQPIEINSALVSAQNRRRLYWTNIEGVTVPEDRGILLGDIIESGFVDRDYFIQVKKTDKFNEKQIITMNPPFALTERRTEEAKKIRREYQKKFGKDFSPRRGKELTPRTDGKMNCLTATYSLKEHVLIVKEATKKGFTEIRDKEGVDLTFLRSKTRRGRAMRTKSNCLTAANYDYCFFKDKELRKLTPIECERLQTVPDNYTNHVSNTQRYKMLGNGWTVDVIAHIIKGIDLL